MELAQRCPNLWNNLGFSLCAIPSVCYIVTTSDKRKKSKIEVSTDWYVTVEHWRLSSIRTIFIDYQTSKLQCNYQSYIQVDNIGDAQGFSNIASITLSRGFSGETLIEVRTLPQKTKLDRSIPIMKDRIFSLLHYY